MIAELHDLHPGSKVLVTGANGYIASHVINVLLELGYKVRGTVRTPKPWLREYFDLEYGEGLFETVLVPDFEQAEVLDKAMDGVSGVVHVANDMSFGQNAQQVISRAIESTINVLRVASRHESIRRVVLTSSSSAAYFSEADKRVVVDQDTWNTTAVETALNDLGPADMKPFIIYGASKTEGERHAWKWVEENQPDFVFNTVLPYNTLGKILHPNIGGSSMAWMLKILEGDTFNFQFPPQWFVDVEDVARLHVIGLLHPRVRSERLFGFAEPFNWHDIVNTLRKLQPHNKLIPDPPENEGRALSYIVPAARAEQLIQEFFHRRGWKSLEDSLREGISNV